MDELVIKGKKYISSKRASELSGYAKDYVGQLIRGGKVNGVRFGRAWYVDESEILAHAGIQDGNKNESQSQNQITSPVSAFEAQKVPKILYSPSQLPTTWSQIRYLEDHTELLPVLREKSEILEHEEKLPLVRGKEPIELKIKASKPLSKLESESPDRIKVLFDGIQPRSAVIRVGVAQKYQEVEPKREEISHKKGAFPASVAVAVVGSFLLALFGFSGLFFSSEVAYVTENQEYTSSVFVSFEHFIELIKDSAFVQGGVSAIVSFFAQIGSSLVFFVGEAINFLKNIF